MAKKKSIKKISHTLDYHEELIKSLQDHSHAVAYLNAALKEFLKRRCRIS